MQPAITAVYAFSADPITYGHINIVERITKTFGGCLVGIGRNPKKSYLFSLNERCELATKALAHLPGVKVVEFDGLLVDFAFEHGAKLIVKGIRNSTDMNYEQTLHQVSASQKLGIDTHILFADNALSHVSSSTVKAMQEEHAFIHEYAPPVVKAALEAKISGQLIIGITGGAASGKSTLAKALIDDGVKLPFNVHYLNMDKLGHDILSGNGIAEPLHKEVVRSITELLGEQVIVNGLLNREQIGKAILDRPLLRKQFNQVLSQPMNVLLRKTLKNKRGVILLEGALLPDFNLLHLSNYRCVLCHAPDDLRIDRMVERNYSQEKSIAMANAQLSTVDKRDVIQSAIEKHGFGQLWEYDSSSGNRLRLDTILSACEEVKWLHNTESQSKHSPETKEPVFCNIHKDRVSKTWLSLMDKVANQELSNLYLQALLSAYSETHRHYHNLTHIMHVVDLLNEADVNDDAVYLAALYHDYVYQPDKSDNESRSADIAELQLTSMGFSEDVINRVKMLIMATKHHIIDATDPSGALFVDADMAILGSSTKRYQDYIEGVRKEYNAYPDNVYKVGRDLFLEKLLASDRIYISDWFYDAYEKIARLNIMKELGR